MKNGFNPYMFSYVFSEYDFLPFSHGQLFLGWIMESFQDFGLLPMRQFLSPHRG
jgi:hypothetical protein